VGPSAHSDRIIVVPESFLRRGLRDREQDDFYSVKFLFIQEEHCNPCFESGLRAASS
jgi:hypothetical protein